MGPYLIVIVEPCRELLQNTQRIRPPMEEHIIALKTLDETFGHAVGFGTVHRRETGHEPQDMGMSHRVVRRIRTPVIRQPFNGMRGLGDGSKAAFDRLNRSNRALARPRSPRWSPSR
jgi:hypothetical protein